MSIGYGFFNAVDNDRVYNADDFNNYFKGVLSDDGVYKSAGDGMEVVPGTGLSVNISPGRLRIQNHFVYVTSAENVPLATASVSQHRYDAIAIRLDKVNRLAEVHVLQGTPVPSQTTPTKPSPTRTGNIWDMILAYVYVGSNVSSISASAIEDARSDTGVCGYAKLYVDAIAAGIEQYTKATTISGQASTLPVGISQYDSTTDVLDVFNNGFLLTPGTDYTVSGSGSQATITFAGPVTNGSTVVTKVTKPTVEVLS